MNMPQLFKTSQQPPRCCHKTKDGSECKATPQTGKKYCFFHDPATKEKRAEARRASAAVRNQTLLPPPNLPMKSLQKPGDVIELLGEVLHRVNQGELDLRTANTMGHLSNIVLNAMKFNFLIEREEREANASRDIYGKKLPPEPIFIFTDPKGQEIYNSNTAARSAAQPSSAPGQQEKQKQNPQNGAAPESAESAKKFAESARPESMKAVKPELVETAKAQPPNNPNRNAGSAACVAQPSPAVLGSRHSAPSACSPAGPSGSALTSAAPPPSPVPPPPRQEQFVSPIPGLQLRHINGVNMIAPPAKPKWRGRRVIQGCY